MRSLVLIGHGSHHHGDSASAVQQAAERLRGPVGTAPGRVQNCFDEVLEGYWQQEPGLRQVLRTVASSNVTVIPLFLAESYLTETVLPRELGLGHQGPVPPGGVARVLGGRRVRYTRPLGVHPGMADVIAARATEALPTGTDPGGVTLLLLTARPGTGTPEAHARALSERGLFADVKVVTLTEPGATEAGLSEWRAHLAAQVGTEAAVLVPFFAHAGGGWQAQLAQALAGPGLPRLHVSGPVGTHPGVADVLLQLAGEGGQEERGDVDQPHAEAWAALRELAERGGRLGEVLLTPHGGLFELRHMLDEGRAAADLRTFVSPEGLRDFTDRDEAGRHRPVRTWRTLPRGWRAVLGPADLRLGLHLLYPAVVEESYAHAHHNLHCTPWASTARRQTGALAKVQRATPDQVDTVAAQVCAPCLRTRLWAGEVLGQTFFSGVPGGLPCAEACSVLLAAVRDEVGAGTA
ncbi:DR2241 family protein [Deinococcus wulumuqiensis]|uniref:Cobalamin biosynthesis protein CbiX n=4 Tax=Deinococcus wulumuqiensis TaxID=980427 RepID=A0AAV4K6T5_9DEIO|nr:DR2241 family protein [Deinococcus wulumuqiensis]QII21641.1 cobalamin biosynthesis protein CbiX [Deinococcus wulumuqiensis R12]GGI90900.1 cobalamin biosynthesis protein CbiX [Deinococcus wulumuqiensis]GGP30898.1 cobalamin biosynthesis protein CbiX [Deinococcus wulumuqiensis]